MKASSMTDIMRAEVNNHSIYLWGAQGENVSDLSVLDILKSETSVDNAKRVINHIIECSDKYNMTNAKAFDCSGLVCRALETLGLIKGDFTANGLYMMGTPINIQNVKEGDLVFKGTDTQKSHVGYVGSGGIVYEAKGRDYGVVTSSVNSGWKYACKYTWFEELNLSEKLKLNSKDYKNKSREVSNVQRALCSHGFVCSVSGMYTQDTVKAVERFQIAYKLNPASPGVIAKKTCLALGMTWKGKSA